MPENAEGFMAAIMMMMMMIVQDVLVLRVKLVTLVNTPSPDREMRSDTVVLVRISIYENFRIRMYND